MGTSCLSIVGTFCNAPQRFTRVTTERLVDSTCQCLSQTATWCGNCRTSTATRSLNTSFCHNDRREVPCCALAMNQETKGKATGWNKKTQEPQPCLWALRKDLQEHPHAPASPLVLHNNMSRSTANFLLKEPSLAVVLKGVDALLKCQPKYLKLASPKCHRKCQHACWSS